MKLTLDQEQALNGIIEFIQRPVNNYKDCATILYAAAGCGKTFLTRIIADKLRGRYSMAGVAPTHKARKVLDRFLNNNSFYTIKTMTVASLLNKMRSHSYIGTKRFERTGSKISLYELFIIDEASMISDKDVENIIRYAFTHKRKLIFVGDKYQIPNPSQKYIVDGGFAYKADSCAFNIPGFELTTNIRQKESNPIIPIYWEMRTAILEAREPVISRESAMVDGQGVKFFTDKEEWWLHVAEAYFNTEVLHKIRIIAYTNDAVKSHNIGVRKLFNRGLSPEQGELLMGYNNIGFPEPYVCNGQDYYIVSVVEVNNKTILDFPRLSGMIIKTKETDTNISAELFVPDIGHRNNQGILQELVKRAEKVNAQGSTKTDYKKYGEIRNAMIFMENIYKFQNEIIGESGFRNTHPLLFRNVTDVIDSDNGVILSNKLTADITERYGEILQKRLQDDKGFAKTERICDAFCIVERDIDYGYAITAHKSQGSTYRSVFIDEADFEKLNDYHDYRLGCDVKTVKEKTQLKYVSYTRPTDNAYVFYKE